MMRNFLRRNMRTTGNTKVLKRKVLRDIILKNEAFFITFIYCFFGVMWILLSDMILESIFHDAKKYKDFQVFQTLKGWLYILFTTLMLYFLIHRRIVMLKKEIEKSAKTYDELHKANIELVKVEAELKYLAY
jgi:type III secretory pathway component EscT